MGLLGGLTEMEVIICCMLSADTIIFIIMFIRYFLLAGPDPDPKAPASKAFTGYCGKQHPRNTDWKKVSVYSDQGLQYCFNYKFKNY